eukprot:283988-Amphidinium_carterae.1
MAGTSSGPRSKADNSIKLSKLLNTKKVEGQSNLQGSGCIYVIGMTDTGAVETRVTTKSQYAKLVEDADETSRLRLPGQLLAKAEEMDKSTTTLKRLTASYEQVVACGVDIVAHFSPSRTREAALRRKIFDKAPLLTRIKHNIVLYQGFLAKNQGFLGQEGRTLEI